MNEAILTASLPFRSTGLGALQAAVRFWFLVAFVGQMLFATYVLGFYGGGALRGDLTAWNKGMPHGYVAGDTSGNVAVAAHLLFAFIVTLGGPLQLIPQVRARFPAFHRWNGRVYLTTVVATSIAGLFMVWTRGTVGDLSLHIAISLNAVLIIVCAAMALRYALARDLQTHRRWALRLFLVASGVWFFRVGLNFWLFVNQGIVGFDPKTFTGPALTFIAFAQYLLPLAVLELYFRAQRAAGAAGRYAMAASLFALTFAMGIGIFVVSTRWLSRL